MWNLDRKSSDLPETVRTAVLVSGGGSNLDAILSAQKAGHLGSAQVTLVISSRAGVKALEHAAAYQIPACVLERAKFSSEKEFQQAVLSALKAARIQLVCLAGYLRLLSPDIIAAFRGRILNIHPSLLPKFGGSGMYGHHVHAAVLKAEEPFSGCSVHVVDEEFDHGPVIASARVPVEKNDTPETLAARILEQEHQLYPKTIAAFSASLIGAPHD